MSRYVQLLTPRKDGSTLAAHCDSILAQTGAWPDEYPLPELPEEFALVWDWYFELRHATPQGQAGPQPVSFSEILAWQQLTGRRLSPEDVYYINLLDWSYLLAYNQETIKNRPKTPAKTGRR